MVTEELTQEIVIEDVDTTDEEEILYALEDARDVASSARADVDIQILEIGGDTVTLEVTGHFDDVLPFMRMWSERS